MNILKNDLDIFIYVLVLLSSLLKVLIGFRYYKNCLGYGKL